MNLRRWIVLATLLGALTGCGGNYSSGDRVLVTKFNYDAGITSPHRYEVVVFKYPRGPIENNTPKNYIKRLLGLPGEIIAIFFGRLFHYAPQPGADPFFDDVKKGIDANELWQSSNMHTTDETGRNVHGHEIDPAGQTMRKWFQDGKFDILRKPPHIALALRRIVYDNDFQAKDMKGKHDRWVPGKSSWKPDKGTGFTHDGGGDSVDWLRYRHLLRPKQGGVPAAGDIKESLIVDAMAYNNIQLQHKDKAADIAFYWVGDLMLECHLEVIDAKGEFWLELSKGINRFRAKWDLATGKCTLYREGLDKKLEELGSQPTGVNAAGTYVIRFANFDARLTVWVDRALPFGDGVDYDPPEVLSKKDVKEGKTWDDIAIRRGPNKDNDLQPASIGTKGARVAVTHISLWRDTYYSTSVTRADYTIDFTGLSNPDKWDVIRATRFAAMYVQPGHYLCLGDNSQASSDSRDWGLVPERLMLGRALVVYYPLDRIGAIR